MNDKKEKLAALDNALIIPEEEEKFLKQKKFEKSLDDDYDVSRKKIKELMDLGIEAIEKFGEVAGETQEPRAYEVLGGLIKTVGDLSKTLVDNGKTKVATNKELNKPSTEEVSQSGSYTQNNNTIFVGSSKELRELLKNNHDDSIIDQNSE